MRCRDGLTCSPLGSPLSAGAEALWSLSPTCTSRSGRRSPLDLPNATAVTGACPRGRGRTRVVDRTRRRVQQTTLGHWGHKHDPLYRSRKLFGPRRGTPRRPGRTEIAALLAAGDPAGRSTRRGRSTKRCVTSTPWGAPQLAREWFDALIADCRAGTRPEVRGMARTMVQWCEAILAWHTTGYVDGPDPRPELAEQEAQTRRCRVPVLRQLPAPDPARLRRLQLAPPRHTTPLKREPRHNERPCRPVHGLSRRDPR